VVDEALAAWEAGELESAAGLVDKLQALVAGQPEQAFGVMQSFADKNAWLLAAMFGRASYEQNQAIFIGERIQLLHKALYLAAKDPKAGDFFDLNKENPIFSVAFLRYRLYYGGNPNEINKRVQVILNAPLVVRRFPEAYLLEVEVIYMSGDNQRAKTALAELLAKPNIQAWVIKQARLLQADIK
jgi:hypothetical protein